MNRRNFIETTSMFGAVAILPIPNFSKIAGPKFKMGYQLYSIRDEMAKDPIATLKTLKGMGYQDFEMYGYNAVQNMIYGFQPKELKQILDDMNLTITSGHYGFAPYLDKSEDDLKRFVDQCITAAKTLNNKYIVWPVIAQEQRTIEYYKVMAGMLNLIGEQVEASGLGFAYHNHGFEFEDHNGENAFDIIIKRTDPALVKFELDMYWLKHSTDLSFSEFVKQHKGRVVMWHIKDMDKVTRDYTELGNGLIDYAKLLPDPIESGLEYYYLEQGGNYTINSTKSAALNAAYCKKYLMKSL